MAIHEKALIRPENLKTHDKLVIDGVDVSGHWSTFIEPRVVTDYNEALEDEIAALPGGERMARLEELSLAAQGERLAESGPAGGSSATGNAGGGTAAAD